MKFYREKSYINLTSLDGNIYNTNDSLPTVLIICKAFISEQFISTRMLSEFLDLNGRLNQCTLPLMIIL